MTPHINYNGLSQVTSVASLVNRHGEEKKHHISDLSFAQVTGNFVAFITKVSVYSQS